MWHDTCVTWLVRDTNHEKYACYGVATISKIIALFCKRDLQKRQYSAKETYNFIDPTDRSHPIAIAGEYVSKFVTACGIFHLRIRDMTHVWHVTIVIWLMCDMTHVWHDSCVTEPMCDMTHVWHDSCVTWLMCDRTQMWHNSCVIWLMCDMTHVWQDSCVTWLMCDMTHVWHDSLTMTYMRKSCHTCE